MRTSRSPNARATIQADVDQLYAEFCALAAANRGLTNEAVRATNAAIYRGELAIRAGLADRLGTLDLAIAEMATELDRAVSPRQSINPTPRRSTPMEAHATEQVQDQLNEPPQPVHVAPAPAANVAPPASGADAAGQLRAEFAEVAAIAAQASRLGITVDAADALKKGIAPDALRRSVLDTLAARAEATSVIVAAPSTPIVGDSPIVRRAKERAASARA